MNPPLPLAFLLPLLALALGIAAWFSWRGSAGLHGARRTGILVLRMTGLLALTALLLNPGKWVRPLEQRERPWLVLLDRSASMSRPLDDKTTRHELASSLAATARKTAEDAKVPLRVQPFDTSAGPVLDPSAAMPSPEGQGTDLTGSLKRITEEAAATGDSFASILVLSDGRQTVEPSPAALEALALRLRSRETPLHVVAVGADIPVPDLIVRAARPSVTAFKGQPVRIPVIVESTGLGPLKPELTLRDESGKELARRSLETTDGKPAFFTFELPAPEASARWTIEAPPVPGEAAPGNNHARVGVQLLDSKTRVFLAEGAPYWDSKFLAQLLRQQTRMEVHSVHRLSDERYFRIDSGEADPTETRENIFPETAAELARYDLVVFGKNVDAFLTPTRLEALRSWVRDRGGAVLFARGKATTGALPALEALEPVSWATGSSDSFRFRPTTDGEASGLFGEALPAPDASIWNSLPLLKDGRRISMVKPFTRVLAEGADEASGGFSNKFPMLLVRRYGQGVCGLVNGDGLWKWDFYPEARELGNMYEDFWTQLIQWMASYSEFLPGQDFSLRLPALKGRPGETQALTVSFRGSGEAPQPVLRIESPTGTTRDLTPAAHPDAGGHPRWTASFTPDAPGSWKLRIVDPRPKAPPAPEASFLVPAPPAEGDNLAPDPAFLETLAASTGGQRLTPEALPGFLKQAFTPEPPTARDAGAVWQPSWSHWSIALLIALPLTAEWWLRRRQGLA